MPMGGLFREILHFRKVQGTVAISGHGRVCSKKSLVPCLIYARMYQFTHEHAQRHVSIYIHILKRILPRNCQT